MQRSVQGTYVSISTAGEQVQAFVPAPLPPSPPHRRQSRAPTR